MMPRPDPGERAAAGKAARAELKRSSHGEWAPAGDRPDPVAVLEEQAVSRVPELVPIRYGRMLESPFAFFRGAAAVMSWDLAQTPDTGLRAQLCGDAHLSNFGGFASPERELVFDLNDFDETLPGPWEWDVKRLAASIAIAGRGRGFGAKQRRKAVTEAARGYRDAMGRFAEMRDTDVWYARLDAETLLKRLGANVDRRHRERARKLVMKAHSKDSLRALEKLTRTVDGRRRIISDPPLIVPVEELDPDEGERVEDEVRKLLGSYRETLGGAGRWLIGRYDYVHLARKVVGVGSVGTRCWIVLLEGRDGNDPLFLQVKEAGESVLAPFAGKSAYETAGRRVVEGQWLMQAASDPLLGWLKAVGFDGVKRDFYLRQLWDWKASAEVDWMEPADLAAYGSACGWTLARAHARSGDSIAIGAYLGSGDSFDRAMAAFAEAYADQNELDFAALGSAAKSERVKVETGA